MSDEFDDCIPVSISQSNTPENSSTSQTNLRRSIRPRHPPDRLVYHNWFYTLRGGKCSNLTK